MIFITEKPNIKEAFDLSKVIDIQLWNTEDSRLMIVITFDNSNSSTLFYNNINDQEKEFDKIISAWKITKKEIHK